MDDNVLFLAMDEALNNQKKQRIKGYYVCLCGNDFMKRIGRSEAICPYCGKIATRINNFNSCDEQVQISIWKECGTYSDIRADKKSIAV